VAAPLLLSAEASRPLVMPPPGHRALFSTETDG
jgi:hypothetical protein